MHEPITILYEDNHCLAVAKSAPLATQAPAGAPSLEALVKNYLKVVYRKSAEMYLGIPHRLDRPVTGVVLFARGTKSARRLAAQFSQRAVRKTYWAIVESEVPSAEGVWEDWLRKLPGDPRSEITSQDAPGAKLARSRYRCLFRLAAGTLLEVEPETGRTHQIRVQCASRGMPVMGDRTYGARLPFGQGTIALHARRLTFDHPIRYEPITVEAPLPASWEDLLMERTCPAGVRSAGSGWPAA